MKENVFDYYIIYLNTLDYTSVYNIMYTLYSYHNYQAQTLFLNRLKNVDTYKIKQVKDIFVYIFL